MSESLPQRVNILGAQVPIFAFGVGDPIVVVHGGPGMDYSYMVSGLAPLGAESTLYFYNQSDLQHPDAKYLVDELASVVAVIAHATGKPVGVIAHSWGTYLVLEALIRESSTTFAKVALLNPLPLTWGRLGDAGGRLMQRVDAADVNRIDELEAEGGEIAGKEIMDLAGYAYLEPNHKDYLTGVERYNPDTNAAVLETIDGYDQRGLVGALPEIPILLVFGRGDHFVEDEVKELGSRSSSVVLEGVAHFPFVESPADLVEVLRDFFQ